jgi:molybdenum cofactor guanylyltransferase
MAVAKLPEFDAIILAGGRGSRLGGADKPGLMVGGTTLAEAVTAAAAGAGAGRVVLVGPARPELAGLAGRLPAGLSVVREDPPGSGPVPALRAGLAVTAAPWVALLAADLPFVRAADVRDLLAIASGGQESGPGPAATDGGPVQAGAVQAGAVQAGAVQAGAVLADDAGAAQWLVSCWRAAALRVALRDYRGASLRGALAPLAPALVRLPGAPGAPPPWLDCDTPAALAQARSAAARLAAFRAGLRATPGARLP